MESRAERASIMIQSTHYGKLPDTPSLEKLSNVVSRRDAPRPSHQDSDHCTVPPSYRGHTHRVMITTDIMMCVIASGVCNPRL
jgi:hypothetical protein